MKSSSPDEWAGGGDFLQAENPAGQDSFYGAHFLFYTKNRLYIEDDDIIMLGNTWYEVFYESDCRQCAKTAFKDCGGNGNQAYHGPDKRNPVQYNTK